MEDLYLWDGKINRLVTIGDEMPDDETTKRLFVIHLMEKWLPSQYGDPYFEFITQGRSMAARKVKSFFSTCGELLMAVMYCMGYRGACLNRDLDADDGGPRTYQFGMNMNYIYFRSRREKLFTRFEGEAKPKMGDLVFASNGTPRSEHVFVFHREVVRNGVTYWETFDAGQGGAYTQSACSKIKKVNGRVIGGKRVLGWIDINKLELTCPVSDPTLTS